MVHGPDADQALDRLVIPAARSPAPARESLVIERSGPMTDSAGIPATSSSQGRRRRVQPAFAAPGGVHTPSALPTDGAQLKLPGPAHRHSRLCLKAAADLRLRTRPHPGTFLGAGAT